MTVLRLAVGPAETYRKMGSVALVGVQLNKEPFRAVLLSD